MIILEYLYQLLALIKKWSVYFGLVVDRQNYEEEFMQLLHKRNYDEALQLAKQHKYLDINLVYQFKWYNSSITIQLINNVLGAIQDKLWAINESVITRAVTYETTKCLIEFGLREANLRLLYELGDENAAKQYSDADGKHGGKLKKKSVREKRPLLNDDLNDEAIIGLIDFDHLNDRQKELCRCRQTLIRYEHSLLAYEHILGDYKTIQQDFDPIFYDEFRRRSPLESCIDFANRDDPHAVEICLDFYTKELRPHLLTILSNLPETRSPYQYRNLLPCLNENVKEFEWRSLSGSKVLQDTNDWSSLDRSNPDIAHLRERDEKFEREFYEKNDQLKRFHKPMTSELLTEWFIQRALEMEARTLLLSNAIQLLNLGMELKIENLKDIHDDLSEFDRIVYDCCTENNIYLSYGEFGKMTEIDKLMLMTGNSLKTCKDKFRFYIIPYLHRREANLTLESKTVILREYFRSLAKAREQICRTIYNDLLDRIECDNYVATWTNGMDDAIDEIGDEIKRIERERQAKQISTMASQTFQLGDYDECYEACQLIIKKNFTECWGLCCQLGMHQKFTNSEAKYKLLAFALANCDDPDGRMSVKILDNVIQLRKRDSKIQMAYLKRNM